MRVIFMHPDLGIGGAERLVVDAAVAMKQRGHHVNIITAHHDRSHCFAETIDGTIDVQVIGDWLPRSLFGRCFAFFAYTRMLLLAFYYCCCCESADMIFCDQISACIPVIRLFSPSTKILFYCHFPDQLLTKRESIAKSLYRWPIDALEQWSTGLAHCVCVNSYFTANVFRQTFTRLAHIKLNILYPTLRDDVFDATSGDSSLARRLIPESATHIFVSLNRFERKKNIQLAIEAFALLSRKLPKSTFDQCHLVIAGGYDERVRENVEYERELKSIVENESLTTMVTFLRSPDDRIKRSLLQLAIAVLYTPSNEHFGIVPIESMYARTPVIAVDSGGPRESIVDNETGYLCQSNANHFADRMKQLVETTHLSQSLGIAGRQRVVEKFVFRTFANELERLSLDMFE